MQPYHNLHYREEEREMMPYCQANGIGIVPWSPLARGILTRPYEQISHREQHDKYLNMLIRSRPSTADAKIVCRVQALAEKHGVSMACIATAWSTAKGCCPIIGKSSTERIQEAILNASFKLH